MDTGSGTAVGLSHFALFGTYARVLTSDHHIAPHPPFPCPDPDPQIFKFQRKDHLLLRRHRAKVRVELSCSSKVTVNPGTVMQGVRWSIG